VTDLDQLSRSYRRLLRAYPAWYRHERGAEMLATLLDGAVPGQRRPAWRDGVNLLLGGLRCRLRPPTGFGYRLIVVLLAVFTAILGIALAGRAAPAGAPTEQQALAAAGVAVPGAPHRVAGPAAACQQCPTWDSGPLARADYVAVFYDPAPDDVAALMGRARDRLAAAGWRVDRDVVVDEDSGDYSIRASKGGIALSLRGTPARVYLDKDLARPDPEQTTVSVVVTRGFSSVDGGVLGAGFLGGLLIGWLLGVWLVRRFRRHRAAFRTALALAALPVLLLAVVVDGIVLEWSTALTVLGGWSWRYLTAPAGSMPEWGILALLVPVMVALLPLPSHARARPGAVRSA